MQPAGSVAVLHRGRGGVVVMTFENQGHDWTFALLPCSSHFLLKRSLGKQIFYIIIVILIFHE